MYGNTTPKLEYYVFLQYCNAALLQKPTHLQTDRHTVYLARIELVETCMQCPDDIHANEEGRYSYQ